MEDCTMASEAAAPKHVTFDNDRLSTCRLLVSCQPVPTNFTEYFAVEAEEEEEATAGNEDEDEESSSSTLDGDDCPKIAAKRTPRAMTMPSVVLLQCTAEITAVGPKKSSRKAANSARADQTVRTTQENLEKAASPSERTCSSPEEKLECGEENDVTLRDMDHESVTVENVAGIKSASSSSSSSSSSSPKRSSSSSSSSPEERRVVLGTETTLVNCEDWIGTLWISLPAVDPSALASLTKSNSAVGGGEKETMEGETTGETWKENATLRVTVTLLTDFAAQNSRKNTASSSSSSSSSESDDQAEGKDEQSSESSSSSSPFKPTLVSSYMVPLHSLERFAETSASTCDDIIASKPLGPTTAMADIPTRANADSVKERSSSSPSSISSSASSSNDTGVSPDETARNEEDKISKSNKIKGAGLSLEKLLASKHLQLETTALGICCPVAVPEAARVLAATSHMQRALHHRMVSGAVRHELTSIVDGYVDTVLDEEIAWEAKVEEGREEAFAIGKVEGREAGLADGFAAGVEEGLRRQGGASAANLDEHAREAGNAPREAEQQPHNDDDDGDEEEDDLRFTAVPSSASTTPQRPSAHGADRSSALIASDSRSEKAVDQNGTNKGELAVAAVIAPSEAKTEAEESNDDDPATPPARSPTLQPEQQQQVFPETPKEEAIASAKIHECVRGSSGVSDGRDVSLHDRSPSGGDGSAARVRPHQTCHEPTYVPTPRRDGSLERSDRITALLSSPMRARTLYPPGHLEELMRSSEHQTHQNAASTTASAHFAATQPQGDAQQHRSVPRGVAGKTNSPISSPAGFTHNTVLLRAASGSPPLAPRRTASSSPGVHHAVADPQSIHPTPAAAAVGGSNSRSPDTAALFDTSDAIDDFCGWKTAGAVRSANASRRNSTEVDGGRTRSVSSHGAAYNSTHAPRQIPFTSATTASTMRSNSSLSNADGQRGFTVSGGADARLSSTAGRRSGSNDAFSRRGSEGGRGSSGGRGEKEAETAVLLMSHDTAAATAAAESQIRSRMAMDMHALAVAAGTADAAVFSAPHDGSSYFPAAGSNNPATTGGKGGGQFNRAASPSASTKALQRVIAMDKKQKAKASQEMARRKEVTARRMAYEVQRRREEEEEHTTIDAVACLLDEQLLASGVAAGEENNDGSLDQCRHGDQHHHVYGSGGLGRHGGLGQSRSGGSPPMAMPLVPAHNDSMLGARKHSADAAMVPLHGSVSTGGKVKKGSKKTASTAAKNAAAQRRIVEVVKGTSALTIGAPIARRHATPYHRNLSGSLQGQGSGLTSGQSSLQGSFRSGHAVRGGRYDSPAALEAFTTDTHQVASAAASGSAPHQRQIGLRSPIEPPHVASGAGSLSASGTQTSASLSPVGMNIPLSPSDEMPMNHGQRRGSAAQPRPKMSSRPGGRLGSASPVGSSLRRNNGTASQPNVPHPKYTSPVGRHIELGSAAAPGGNVVALAPVSLEALQAPSKPQQHEGVDQQSDATAPVEGFNKDRLVLSGPMNGVGSVEGEGEGVRRRQRRASSVDVPSLDTVRRLNTRRTETGDRQESNEPSLPSRREPTPPTVSPPDAQVHHGDDAAEQESHNETGAMESSAVGDELPKVQRNATDSSPLEEEEGAPVAPTVVAAADQDAQAFTDPVVVAEAIEERQGDANAVESTVVEADQGAEAQVVEEESHHNPDEERQTVANSVASTMMEEGMKPDETKGDKAVPAEPNPDAASCVPRSGTAKQEERKEEVAAVPVGTDVSSPSTTPAKTSASEPPVKTPAPRSTPLRSPQHRPVAAFRREQSAHIRGTAGLGSPPGLGLTSTASPVFNRLASPLQRSATHTDVVHRRGEGGRLASPPHSASPHQNTNHSGDSHGGRASSGGEVREGRGSSGHRSIPPPPTPSQAAAIMQLSSPTTRQSRSQRIVASSSLLWGTSGLGATTSPPPAAASSSATAAQQQRQPQRPHTHQKRQGGGGGGEARGLNQGHQHQQKSGHHQRSVPTSYSALLLASSPSPSAAPPASNSHSSNTAGVRSEGGARSVSARGANLAENDSVSAAQDTTTTFEIVSARQSGGPNDACRVTALPRATASTDNDIDGLVKTSAGADDAAHVESRKEQTNRRMDDDVDHDGDGQHSDDDHDVLLSSRSMIPSDLGASGTNSHHWGQHRRAGSGSLDQVHTHPNPPAHLTQQNRDPGAATTADSVVSAGGGGGESQQLSPMTGARMAPLRNPSSTVSPAQHDLDPADIQRRVSSLDANESDADENELSHGNVAEPHGRLSHDLQSRASSSAPAAPVRQTAPFVDATNDHHHHLDLHQDVFPEEKSSRAEKSGDGAHQPQVVQYIPARVSAIREHSLDLSQDSLAHEKPRTSAPMANDVSNTHGTELAGRRRASGSGRSSEPSTPRPQQRGHGGRFGVAGTSGVVGTTTPHGHHHGVGISAGIASGRTTPMAIDATLIDTANTSCRGSVAQTPPAHLDDDALTPVPATLAFSRGASGQRFPALDDARPVVSTGAPAPIVSPRPERPQSQQNDQDRTMTHDGAAEDASASANVGDDAAPPDDVGRNLFASTTAVVVDAAVNAELPSAPHIPRTKQEDKHVDEHVGSTPPQQQDPLAQRTQQSPSPPVVPPLCFDNVGVIRHHDRHHAPIVVPSQPSHQHHQGPSEAGGSGVDATPIGPTTVKKKKLKKSATASSSTVHGRSTNAPVKLFSSPAPRAVSGAARAQGARTPPSSRPGPTRSFARQGTYDHPQLAHHLSHDEHEHGHGREDVRGDGGDLGHDHGLGRVEEPSQAALPHKSLNLGSRTPPSSRPGMAGRFAAGGNLEAALNSLAGPTRPTAAGATSAALPSSSSQRQHQSSLARDGLSCTTSLQQYGYHRQGSSQPRQQRGGHTNEPQSNSQAQSQSLSQSVSQHHQHSAGGKNGGGQQRRPARIQSRETSLESNMNEAVDDHQYQAPNVVGLTRSPATRRQSPGPSTPTVAHRRRAAAGAGAGSAGVVPSATTTPMHDRKRGPLHHGNDSSSHSSPAPGGRGHSTGASSKRGFVPPPPATLRSTTPPATNTATTTVMATSSSAAEHARAHGHAVHATSTTREEQREDRPNLDGGNGGINDGFGIGIGTTTATSSMSSPPFMSDSAETSGQFGYMFEVAPEDRVKVPDMMGLASPPCPSLVTPPPEKDTNTSTSEPTQGSAQRSVHIAQTSAPAVSTTWTSPAKGNEAVISTSAKGNEAVVARNGGQTQDAPIPTSSGVSSSCLLPKRLQGARARGQSSATGTHVNAGDNAGAGAGGASSSEVGRGAAVAKNAKGAEQVFGNVVPATVVPVERVGSSDASHTAMAPPGTKRSLRNSV